VGYQVKTLGIHVPEGLQKRTEREGGSREAMGDWGFGWFPRVVGPNYHTSTRRDRLLVGTHQHLRGLWMGL
jgi:hypothetical protein